MTIDIGPNDLFRGGGVPAIAANLPVILVALRDAAGPGVPIVGMDLGVQSRSRHPCERNR